MARILIIAYTNYYQDGRVKRHAEALAERGDHVDLICLAHGPRGLSRGVNIIALPMPRYRGGSNRSYIWSYLRFFVVASLRATRLSRQRPYDVVIVCTMPDAAILCAMGPKLYGAKIVLDVHDTMPELYEDKFKGLLGTLGSRFLRAEERASSWLADLVLAVHEPHRQRLARNGIPARKLRVVLNLPDGRLFRLCRSYGNGLLAKASIKDKSISVYPDGSAPEPEPSAKNSNEFRLVCHGTITVRLGLDLAVRAVGLLRNKIPSIRLHVIGEGDFLPAVKELTVNLGLQQHVTFTPSMPIEQLPAVLAKAAVGIVPNRASSATHLMLPVKLLEYAALGIPAIAARLQTIEYYFPADSVRYFQPGDVHALAEAIEDLYLHCENRHQLSRKTAEIAAELNWDDERCRLFEAIDSLLILDSPSTTSSGELRPVTQINHKSQAGGQSCDTAKP